MLSLLTLPITWLAFYSLGRILDSASSNARRYAIVCASALVLLAAAGPTTCFFYIALSLAIVFAGHSFSQFQDPRLRRAVFVVAITAIGLMIFAYLKWRMYFQKYFVHLPSLSYLGFRGIAVTVQGVCEESEVVNGARRGRADVPQRS